MRPKLTDLSGVVMIDCPVHRGFRTTPNFCERVLSEQIAYPEVAHELCLRDCPFKDEILRGLKDAETKAA